MSYLIKNAKITNLTDFDHCLQIILGGVESKMVPYALIYVIQTTLEREPSLKNFKNKRYY